MGLSPRTLRPANNFTPRSITGLALWLDASDASTLFQDAAATTPATATSDPVGAWLDKSGNARHATQSVSASRPTVGSSSKAGKNAVRNNGTGSVALQVAAWPYTAGNTQFAVFNASALNQAVAQRGTLNDEPRFAIQSPASGVVSVNATRGGSSAAQTSSTVGYPTSQWAIGATLFNTALGRAYRDGVYGADTTDSQTFSGDQELRLLSLPSNIYGLNGGIAEFLHYDRQLTASEVTRVARYLAARWGIALAPQVSNVDAQDWVNRVYANGGVLTASTAAAVNQFCVDIENAPGGSIRDRFYRLNLFCGSNLNAALVPLYRSASFGGSPLGNAIDTNQGPFATGAYTEATGLTPALASGHYLDTGLTPDAMPLSVVQAMHLAASHGPIPSGNAGGYFIGAANGSTDRHFIQWNVNAATAVTVFSPLGKTNAVSSASIAAGSQPSAIWVSSRTTPTSLSIYKNGVADGTPVTTSVTGIASYARAFSVCRCNFTGSIVGDSYNLPHRHYSIGAGLSGPEVAAYNNALSAFFSAIGRTA